jgi:hypothetical protein
MFSAVDTKDAAAVQREVRVIFNEMFPGSDDHFIGRAFDWVVDCFDGNCPGYQAIDARYHDLEHTLQGTLCLARVLRGRHNANRTPWLTEKMFELALLAILMHDTGYLKRTADHEGTGAKYTLTHVRRSTEFARDFLSKRGYADADIAAVQNMIRCTGVNADLSAIPFANDLEKHLGFALGTADLLGQMAADDYVEKLPVLYQEFAEAAKHSGGAGTKSISFNSAEELMRNTPQFWECYVWPKIRNDFGELYRFLADPYPDGPNFYLDRIQANIAELQRRFSAAAVK